MAGAGKKIICVAGDFVFPVSPVFVHPIPVGTLPLLIPLTGGILPAFRSFPVGPLPGWVRVAPGAAWSETARLLFLGGWSLGPLYLILFVRPVWTLEGRLLMIPPLESQHGR